MICSVVRILAKLFITVPIFAVPEGCWPPLFLFDTGPPTPAACRHKTSEKKWLEKMMHHFKGITFLDFFNWCLKSFWSSMPFTALCAAGLYNVSAIKTSVNSSIIPLSLLVYLL